MPTSNKVSQMLTYGWAFIGIRYRYAGNNPILGIDCSGLVCEMLRSIGMIGREDLSSRDLYKKFEADKLTAFNELKEGSIVFYGESIDKISHVAMYIGEGLILEAGGGKADTDTPEEADALNAFVRMRPLRARKDLVVAVHPKYS